MSWIDMWTGTWSAFWGTDAPDLNERQDFYNIQVEIYDDSDHTQMLDIINARYEPNCLEEIRGNGAGSFKVSKNDPKVMNNPSLLAYRKYVKIRLNSRVIGGWIIQTKKTVIVGAGEEKDEFWEVSGEGPKSWSRDASVYPANGLKSQSAETRYFNFATERGPWYNPTEWVQPVNIAKVRSADSWWGTGPVDWPDAPDAYWVWSETSGPVGSVPTGFNYFRHEFDTTGDAAYSLFIATDNEAEVYVDGELLLTTPNMSWQETSRIDFNLAPGSHVIGVKCWNEVLSTVNPGAIVAAFFKVGDATAPTAATLLSYTGQSTWKVNGYPELEPGWNIGDVLLTLLEEAEERGVRFAQNFTPQFSRTFDSGGNEWGNTFSFAFGVGTTYEEVFSSLEELGCDLYVDPDTLDFYAWKKRGSSRVDTVILSPGHNLVSADETGQAEIANTLMLRTPEGWQESTAEDATSFTKYGRVETQLSTKLTRKGAEPLIQELFRQKALPEVSATFEIVPVPDMVPLENFRVGDYIMAPTEIPGYKEPRRVMSIAFTEDERTGLPRYAIEFDTIFKDRQTELEKWLSRLANGSAIGGGFSNWNNLPSKTVNEPPSKSLGSVPDPPTGLMVASVGKYTEEGTSSSDFGITWNPVVTGKGFGTVQITHYEVWGRLTSEMEPQLMATVFDTMAYLTGFRPGDEWAFKVRAFSRTGGPGEFCEEVALVAEPPRIPLEKPTAPILSTGFGTVTVTWDGILGSTPAPSWMRYVQVERALDPEGPWTAIGTLIRHQLVDRPGNVGATVYYRFIAIDGYKNTSPYSDVSSIIVKGVNSGDIAGGLASNNLVQNGSFEDGLIPAWKIINKASNADVVVDESASFSGAHYLRMSRGSATTGIETVVAQSENFFIPISSVGNHGYFVSAKAASLGNINASFSIRVYWWDAEKIAPASVAFSDVVIKKNLKTEAAYFTGKVFPPVDARYMQVAVVHAAENSTIYVDDVVAREVMTENMIGEDAITAVHLSAGSVTTNAMQANSVTTDILDAGAVRADNIKAGAIQVSHLSPSVGDNLDISSNSSVNILIDRTDRLQSGLDDTNGTVEELTTYYSFGPDGAIIGQTDSAFKLFLKNDRIEIIENGIVVSYWDSGQMVVPSFVGEEVVLGNHKLEKYSTGTVVRAI